MGDVVADPSGSWEPSTAEAYIDQQVENLNTSIASETLARQAGDSNLQTGLTSEMGTRSSQDANLLALINAGIRQGSGVEFDIVPTQNSANGITSGGMYSTLKDSNLGFVDDGIIAKSSNLVKGGDVLNTILNNNSKIFKILDSTYIDTDGKLKSPQLTKWITIVYLVDSAKVRLYGSENVSFNYKSCSIFSDSELTNVITTYDIPNTGYIDIELPSKNQYYYVAIDYNYIQHQISYLKDIIPVNKKFRDILNLIEGEDILDSIITDTGTVESNEGTIIRSFKPIYNRVSVKFNNSHVQNSVVYAFYKTEMTDSEVIEVVKANSNIAVNHVIDLSVPKGAGIIAFNNDEVEITPISNSTSYSGVAQDSVLGRYEVLLDSPGYIKLDGGINSAYSYSHSDFKECYQGDFISVDLIGANNAVSVAYYNHNKQIILEDSIANISAKGIYQVPNNPDICYVRFSCYLQRVAEVGKAAVIPAGGRSKYDIMKTIIDKQPFIFTGKKALFVGDSITKGYINASYTTPNPYCKIFCDSVGMTISNNAINGACFADITGYNIKTIPTQFSEADLSDVDYLFIAGGTNDHAKGVPLSNFKNSVKTMFNNVVTTFTASRSRNSVFVITPINKTRYDSSIIEPLDEYRYILSEEALMHRFNLIDGRDAGFPTVEGEYARLVFSVRDPGDNDYIHPSEEGHKIYAKFLKSIIL